VRSRIIRPAVARANLRREREGLPPLPDAITLQSLRRTYISIALMVSGYDLQWVMAQVGHTDSDTTTKIYEQLQKRRNRDAYGRRSTPSSRAPKSCSGPSIRRSIAPHGPKGRVATRRTWKPVA
jgi:hypothetical protein